ncbi:PREDICTED: E3 ubiquitin-protein ligase SP1-like [Tarenaya hassleriana]|uniref:E3 ubiquitin-protein ligase SP1-like n=1 Tax=Tarenaya hassleriana TaxID=28532 RepID=UPI00053C13BA|nr:PREDICTED: E3 ubiquitin-protein ligase SP1-like [Tarenaya hassleriana]
MVFDDPAGPMDDGTGHIVHVADATNLTSAVGSEVSEVFEGQKSHYIDENLKLIRLKRTEHILQIGTLLTVVGEAIKDDSGEITIQKPKKGSLYISAELKLDGRISNVEEISMLFKYASAVLMAFGVLETAFAMLKRRKWLAFRSRALALALAAAAGKAEQETEGQDCVVCLDREPNALFLKCGHNCCCMACSSRLKRCPLCRRRIDEAVKIRRRRRT